MTAKACIPAGAALTLVVELIDDRGLALDATGASGPLFVVRGADDGPDVLTLSQAGSFNLDELATGRVGVLLTQEATEDIEPGTYLAELSLVIGGARTPTRRFLFQVDPSYIGSAP